MKFIFTVLVTLLLSSSTYARDTKLELGLGVASLYYPDYLGSASRQLLTLPVPHIRYRGDYIRIDEDGLSGKLFGINGLRLEMSLSGSLPASSENSDAREGMPDLDLTGEIGPKLVYNIFEHGVALLEFELPVRAVFSTDFSDVKYRGVTSSPQLKYSLKYDIIEWTLRTGLLFSNKEYNSYFYEVSQEYATQDREAYKTESGFSGFKNRVGVTYKKDNIWAGAFISHFNIKNATFANSPLVEEHHTVYIGASISYIFYTID